MSVPYEPGETAHDGAAHLDAPVSDDASAASRDGVFVPWPLPARFVDHLTLETPRATLLYWLGLGLVVGSLFVSKLLPCVDYPQHLALSDIARRLANPNAPEHAQFVLNYFTYNGLFHIVVAKLSVILPIELAGRIVLAGSLAVIGAAVLALLKVLRRPPVYAALFTPIVFSFSVAWGFANFTMGTAIALVTLVLIARTVARPSWPHILAVAILGLVCAATHVLAMLILCLAATAIAVELAWRSIPPRSGLGPLARGAGRTLVALLPLLLGCIYCIQVYREQYDWDPGMYRDPTLEGTAPPLWQKVLFFGAFATDLNTDGTDQIILIAGMTLIAVVTYWVWRGRRGAARRSSPLPSVIGAAGEVSPPARPFVLPFAVLSLAYFATPMVLVGTHLIFPRLAQWAVFGLVLAAPEAPRLWRDRVARYALAIGIAAGANLVIHTAIFAYETNDASKVIDDLPEGRKATAVIWNPKTFAFRNGTLVHLAACYAARKHGDWAFSFARYLSVPVRFKRGGQPPWPERGWEFSAEDYNPRCKYARVYDLVIVKAPPEISQAADGEKDVRKRVFGRDADAVKLLSHHGKYWAFDTAGLPEEQKL